MMRQYREIKEKLPPNSILLFRLGDFFELFEDDAERGAGVLGITLTQRNGQPMAGIPHHAFDSYVGKLLQAGYKVAVCDQVETPKPGKLVERRLTRILTPGTTIEAQQLEEKRGSYVLAVEVDKSGIRCAWMDLSTGEFVIAAEDRPEDLLPVLAGLAVREVVIVEGAEQAWQEEEFLSRWGEDFARHFGELPVTEVPGFQFDPIDGHRLVCRTLGVLNLDGFDVPADHAALGAAGALIAYATDNLCAAPANLRAVRRYRSGGTLLLDPATLRNLEIVQSASRTREGSLLAAIDRTMTAPGARCLENWLTAPLLDLEVIRERQAIVGTLQERPSFLADLRKQLRGIRDLQRILSRLLNRMLNPRELGAIRDTLFCLPPLKKVLRAYEDDVLGRLADRIEESPTLKDQLDAALLEELPNNVMQGDCVREGYDEELDRVRSLMRNGRTWMAEFESAEQARTGIKNLRVRFNNAFGYFIEVTKANLARVPEAYTRKQTTVNAERFTTPELKEREREILNAEERTKAREEELLRTLAESVLVEAVGLHATAAALAELDVLCGWADLARDWRYGRPEVDTSHVLEIEGGRHPVIEQMMRASADGIAGAKQFVPNDTNLSADGEQIALITGPNMAGKSTYIRQVALITLMAQIGCWVPAERCRIGWCDRIFSRVGASDELARGNSTFMVEMNETANILNHATDRSLIILDEIGRGTSTYDGLSIAWAVAEHLHGAAEAGPRTLFATHYHELTKLESSLSRLRNYTVTVKEWNEEIVFVRTVKPGAADRSYGIQVARLAGLPDAVVARAQVILEGLEADSAKMANGQPRRSPRLRESRSNEVEQPGQLGLF